MNKFMCPGTRVVNKVTQKDGKVITIDRKSGTAVIESKSGVWTERVQNLEVISYKEVM